MHNRPKVSVIMPTYDSSEFVGESLSSVLNQTYENLELIVIDDCSNDKTLSILRGFSKKDPRVFVLSNKFNLGPLESRNKGIRISRGDYIAFLDHDDMWLNDKLEIQIKMMRQKSWFFSYTNYRKISDDGSRVGRLIVSPTIYNLSKLLTDTGIALSSVVYDKSKVGVIFFDNVKPYTEFSLYLKLISIVRNGNLVPHDLLRYRVSKSSISRNKFKMARVVWNNYANLGFGFFITSYFFMSYLVRGILRHLK